MPTAFSLEDCRLAFTLHLPVRPSRNRLYTRCVFAPAARFTWRLQRPVRPARPWAASVCGADLGAVSQWARTPWISGIGDGTENGIAQGEGDANISLSELSHHIRTEAVCGRLMEVTTRLTVRTKNNSSFLKSGIYTEHFHYFIRVRGHSFYFSTPGLSQAWGKCFQYELKVEGRRSRPGAFSFKCHTDTLCLISHQLLTAENQVSTTQDTFFYL